MITPAEMEAMSAELVRMYERMELDLLESIAGMIDYRFAPGDGELLEWQIEKLQQMGALRQKNIRIIAKVSGKSEKLIADILAEIGHKAVDGDDLIYSEAFNRGLLSGAAIPARYSLALRSIIDTAISNTRSYYNLINTNALESAQDGFLRIVNQAYLEVVTGVTDYQSAVRKTVRQLADQGITGMTYTSASGRVTRNHVDVAARRAILTSSAQMTAQMQLQRASEWGSDLVEVSSHVGARPTHAVWQGAIYSINGSTPKYPNLASATGYGTAEGLCGVNCRHVFYPFFDGISEQRYRPYDQSYNDRMYALSQQQRGIERSIREQQRRMVAAKASGDNEAASAAKAKLEAKRAEMSEFIESTTRTRRRERESI